MRCIQERDYDWCIIIWMSIAHDIIMFCYVIMLCHVGLISFCHCYTLIKVIVESCGRWEE